MSELTLIEKNAGNKKEEAQVLVLVPARVKKKKNQGVFYSLSVCRLPGHFLRNLCQ